MNTKDKSLGYTLFVDEEMDKLFHVFLTLLIAWFDEINHTGMSGGLTQEKIDEIKSAAVKFGKAMENPSHELGWCKDPECTWVPEAKK